jgi:hypothetical protein
MADDMIDFLWNTFYLQKLIEQFSILWTNKWQRKEDEKTKHKVSDKPPK